MAEYINREAALDIVNGWREQLIPTYGKNDEYVKCLETVAEHLETLPAADVVERKAGKWISYIEDGYLECPFCGAATNCDGDESELHFCFSCGAKMEAPTDV